MRRYFITSVVASLAITAMPATAQADRSNCNKKLERSYSKHYQQVVNRHGKRAPGRNIRKYGVLYKKAVFDAVCSEIRRSNRQLVQLLTTPKFSYSKPIPPSQPPAGVMTDSTQPSLSGGGSSNPMVDPNCESGGNPATNTGNGYYGKYQFDMQTWQAHGGTGLPSNAPEWVQDQVAARVNYDAWPNC